MKEISLKHLMICGIKIGDFKRLTYWRCLILQAFLNTFFSHRDYFLKKRISPLLISQSYSSIQKLFLTIPTQYSTPTYYIQLPGHCLIRNRISRSHSLAIFVLPQIAPNKKTPNFSNYKTAIYNKTSTIRISIFKYPLIRNKFETH